MSITTAALAALKNGDPSNFIAASTPGGIELQEAQGQAALVRASDRLPIAISGKVTRDDIAREWGVVFGDQIDDLFIAAKLPDGWQIKPTNHSMHSNIIDSHGRVRGSVFYKAAFYDRKARLSVDCRYRVINDYETPVSTVTVMDYATETPVHTEGTADYENYCAINDLEDKALAWLNANFPDHENKFAYWNN